ncbi:hypothetical protein KH5H1_51610 [Corallococcus caeni]|uniref:hypothetical protein n=1 Tax=Corallococcus caeni TaxID=3082388 RepID=UPI00295792DC|nr:hypothetical protein KH5H1_51610 [Corallococcus sp. KH5-1]
MGGGDYSFAGYTLVPGRGRDCQVHGGRPSPFQVLHALSLEPLAEALDGHGLAQRLE